MYVCIKEGRHNIGVKPHTGQSDKFWNIDSC